MRKVAAVCVLRGGGIYTPSWVRALRAGLDDAGNRDLPLLCLTDWVFHLPGVTCLPLAYRWEGWWAKMELFTPGRFQGWDLLLYLDLDTLPILDVSPLLDYEGELASLSDFYSPAFAQSGVLLFRDSRSTRNLWREWIRSPRHWISEYSRRKWGDGNFLHNYSEPERLDRLYPGRIVSFKKHARRRPPEGAVLVCGHGVPRFSDPRTGWAHQLWKRRVG